MSDGPRMAYLFYQSIPAFSRLWRGNRGDNQTGHVSDKEVSDALTQCTVAVRYLEQATHPDQALGRVSLFKALEDLKSVHARLAKSINYTTTSRSRRKIKQEKKDIEEAAKKAICKLLELDFELITDQPKAGVPALSNKDFEDLSGNLFIQWQCGNFPRDHTFSPITNTTKIYGALISKRSNETLAGRDAIFDEDDTGIALNKHDPANLQAKLSNLQQHLTHQNHPSEPGKAITGQAAKTLDELTDEAIACAVNATKKDQRLTPAGDEAAGQYDYLKHRIKNSSACAIALDKLQVVYSRLPNGPTKNHVKTKAEITITELLRLEFPSLPLDSRTGKEIHQNVVNLWEKGLFERNILLAFACGKDNLKSELGSASTTRQVALDDEINAFKKLTQDANDGQFPDAILAQFSHIRDKVVDFYTKSALARGELEIIGQRRAECLFAKAAAVRILTTNDPGTDKKALLFTEAQKNFLVSDPHALLEFSKKHPNQTGIVNILLFQIASLQNELSISEAYINAKQQSDKSQDLKDLEITEAYKAAVEVIDTQHKFDVAQEKLDYFERTHPHFNPNNANSATLTLEYNEIDGAVSKARFAQVKASSDLLKKSAIFKRHQLVQLRNKRDLTKNYIDSQSIKELGLDNPRPEDLARIVDKLYRLKLINTHEAAETTDAIRKGRPIYRSKPFWLIKTVWNAFASVVRFTSGKFINLPRYDAYTRPTMMQQLMAEGSRLTAEQKANRFEDVFYRWLANSNDHNLKASDDLVRKGWANKAATFREMDIDSIKVRQCLESTREAINNYRNTNPNDLSALHTARKELDAARASVRGAIGFKYFDFIHFTIIASILDARPKALDINHVQMTQFNAIDYFENIKQTVGAFGIEKTLGVPADLFQVLIEFEAAALPTLKQPEIPDNSEIKYKPLRVIEYEQAKIDYEKRRHVVQSTETYTAHDLERHNQHLGAFIRKYGGFSKALLEPAGVDEILSHLRTGGPVQAKSAFFVSGTNAGSALFFAQSYTLGSIVEIKRSKKSIEIRIRPFDGGSLALNLGGGSVISGGLGFGEAAIKSKGVNLHFSDLPSAQRFVKDFFDETKKITLENWVNHASEWEATDRKINSLDTNQLMTLGAGAKLAGLTARLYDEGLIHRKVRTGNVTRYRNLDGHEIKMKETVTDGMEQQTNFLNVGDYSASGGKIAGAGEGGVSVPTSTTGISSIRADNFVQIKRHKIARSPENIIHNSTIFYSIPLDSKDPGVSIQDFLKSTQDNFHPVVEKILENKIFLGKIEKQLAKSQQNEMMVIELELNPIALEIVQRLDLEKNMAVNKLNEEKKKEERQILRERIAKIEQDINEQLEDLESNYDVLACMMNPVRQLGDGLHMNLVVISRDDVVGYDYRESVAFIPWEEQ